MGRHFGVVRWKNVNILLQKMAHRNSRNSFICQQEFSPSHHSLASSFLAVMVLLWLWKRSYGRPKSKLSLSNTSKSSRSCHFMEAAIDVCKFFFTPMLFGYIILALTCGTEWTARYMCSESSYTVKDYNPSNFHNAAMHLVNLLMEYYSVNTLTVLSRGPDLILLLLTIIISHGSSTMKGMTSVTAPGININIKLSLHR